MSLELKNVEKKVGLDTHIYQTNLKLEKNTINILLGPTLSGKTTLMQIMAGLDKPTNGEIWFNEKNVTGMKVQKRNVSMVYQQFINYPNFTVYDNIASPLRITGVSSDETKQRVGKVAELLKLSGMLNKKPNELSGGQQQRTALARALVKDSDLILLDEPLANLDFKLREELREELPKLFENRDCIVVYATTEPSEALLLGGNTATLQEGKIIHMFKDLFTWAVVDFPLHDDDMNCDDKGPPVFFPRVCGQKAAIYASRGLRLGRPHARNRMIPYDAA